MEQSTIQAIVVPEALLGPLRGVGLRLSNFYAAVRSSSSIISSADISFLYAANLSVSQLNREIATREDLFATALSNSVNVDFNVDTPAGSEPPVNFDRHYGLYDLPQNATWSNYALMFCKIPSNLSPEALASVRVAYDIVGYDGTVLFIVPYPVVDGQVLINDTRVSIVDQFKKTMEALFTYMPFNKIVTLPVFRTYVNMLV